jgi:hypothetical protein
MDFTIIDRLNSDELSNYIAIAKCDENDNLYLIDLNSSKSINVIYAFDKSEIEKLYKVSQSETCCYGMQQTTTKTSKVKISQVEWFILFLIGLHGFGAIISSFFLDCYRG